MPHHTRKHIRNAGQKFRIVHSIRFICMVLATTILVIFSHDVYFYEFNNTIVRLFLRRNVRSLSGDAKFTTLVTMTEWWSFFEDTFIPIAHETAEDREDTFLGENIIVGTVRLRQIRVEKNTCLVYDVFNRYFNCCYAPYHPSIEYKAPTFKGTKYYTFDELPVLPVQGSAYDYVGPGYVVFLSKTREKNEDIIVDLKDKEWIDSGTRALLIEFALFNVNLNIFINVKFLTEILPTGNVVTSSKIKILPIHNLWSTTKLYSLIIVSVFYFQIIHQTSDEIWLMLRMGVLGYLSNIWNLVDCSILASAYVALIQSVNHPFRMSEQLDIIEKDYTANLYLDELCHSYYVFKFAMAFCAVSSWVKIFRFITFNETMIFFSEALRRGSKDILGFAFMFTIVFIAYALLGLVLFCDSNPGFSTFPKSLVTMTRMLMGDFQYNLLERSNRMWGPMFFISYILFVFFILLNMFLAVISDTYVNVRHHVLMRNRNTAKIYLKSLARKIRNFMKKLGSKILEKLDLSSAQDGKTPRALRKGAALKEFYGNTPDNTANPNAPENENNKTEENESDRGSLQEESLHISQRLKNLEMLAEQFIGKMDRIIHKLEVKHDEENKNES